MAVGADWRRTRSLVPNNYAHGLGPFDQRHRFWLTYYQIVFRATRTAARLTISDWLDPDNSHPFSQVVTSSGRDRLDVIRSDKRTANLKRSLAALDFGVYVLAEAITQVDGYDVTVLDSAPSVDMLHTAALLAADLLIIPTRLDQLSVKGIRELLQSLTTLQGSGRATCELAGVLPTFYDRVTRESFEQLAHLAKSFSDRILPPIPLDTQCRVATRYGKTLWEHNPDTRALVGVPNNSDLNVGGYTQVLQRLEDEL